MLHGLDALTTLWHIEEEMPLGARRHSLRFHLLGVEDWH